MWEHNMKTAHTQKNSVFKKHVTFHVCMVCYLHICRPLFGNNMRHCVMWTSCWDSEVLSKKVNLASQSCCVPLPGWGSLLVLMTHGKLNWLLFPSPSVPSCAVWMGFGKWEQPPFAASSLIYGTVWCGANITYAEKIVCSQLCKYPCLLNTSLVLSLHCKYLNGWKIM